LKPSKCSKFLDQLRKHQSIFSKNFCSSEFFFKFLLFFCDLSQRYLSCTVEDTRRDANSFQQLGKNKQLFNSMVDSCVPNVATNALSGKFGTAQSLVKTMHLQFNYSCNSLAVKSNTDFYFCSNDKNIPVFRKADLCPKMINSLKFPVNVLSWNLNTSAIKD
jgi:hypothetical protein